TDGTDAMDGNGTAEIAPIRIIRSIRLLVGARAQEEPLRPPHARATTRGGRIRGARSGARARRGAAAACAPGLSPAAPARAGLDAPRARRRGRGRDRE